MARPRTWRSARWCSPPPISTPSTGGWCGWSSSCGSAPRTRCRSTSSPAIPTRPIWALDGHGNGRKLTRGAEATPTDLRLVRGIVEAGPYPEAEIHLTEWSSSSSSRDFTHDYPQAAAFVVRSVLASIGLVDSLAYWTFTDIFEEEEPAAIRSTADSACSASTAYPSRQCTLIAC